MSMPTPINLFHKILPVFAIIAVGAGLYANTLEYPFHGEDQVNIAQNPSIRDLTAPQAISRLTSPPTRFITFLSFAVNYYLHGLDVTGYHIVNLSLHILNALLVWQLIQLFFNIPKIHLGDLTGQRNWISLFCALIFLAHPVQTQAVTFISHRGTLLGTFFYLITLCLYLHSRLKEGGVKKYLFLAAVIAGLGMLSHAMTLTLPLVIILMEFMFLKSEKSMVGADRDFKIHHLVIILCFTLIIPSFYRFGYEDILGRQFISLSHDLKEETVTGLNYLITQPRVLVTYLKVLFFPAQLNFDYDFSLSKSFMEIPVIFSLFVLVSMTILALRFYMSAILFSFGVLWFFLTLSVESTVIPLPNVIAEHRLYLPLVGISLGWVACLYSISKRNLLNKVVLAIILIIFCFLTVQRNDVYRNGITLWSDVIKKSPGKVRAYNNLGLAYLQQGDINLAIDSFQKAISINPRYAKAYHNMSVIEQRQGQYDQAFIYIEKALTQAPDNPVFLNCRGEILFSKRLLDRALVDFNKAIERNRNYAEAYNNRGNVYKLKGDRLLAQADFNKAILINPFYDQAYNNRGLVYRSEKKYNEALEEFTRAIKINPVNVAAINNRGLTYKDQDKYELALKDFDRVLQLDPHREQVYNNRGLVYEKRGNLELALKDYSQAIVLNPGYAGAYTNRGFVYLKSNKFELALADFNKAVETSVNPSLSYYYRSQAYFAMGQIDNAQKDLKQAQALGYKPDEAYIHKLQKALDDRQEK